MKTEPDKCILCGRITAPADYDQICQPCRDVKSLRGFEAPTDKRTMKPEQENALAFLLFSCAQRVSNRIDERNGRQKFQLTPFEGWERMTNQQKTEWAEESEALASEILECLKFQRKQDLPNYQTTTAEERMIEDLNRENNAAFRRIQQLSEAIYALGYDPTQLP